MSLEIIPAIDLRGGKVVRLRQGRVEDETVYSLDPLSVANRWASYDGVRTIHIVDLDGAITGVLANFDIVRRIANEVKVKVEFGGGLRDEGTIGRVLEAGISKVVVGTKALEKSFLKNIAKRFGDRIVIGIDAKDGVVYTKGWLTNSGTRAKDLAREAAGFGIRTINYTDISRDGMLTGFNIPALKELLEATDIGIVAGGGISTIEDIKRLLPLSADGLSGVVMGKSLYENSIDLAEALKAAGAC